MATFFVHPDSNGDLHVSLTPKRSAALNALRVMKKGWDAFWDDSTNPRLTCITRLAVLISIIGLTVATTNRKDVNESIDYLKDRFASGKRTPPQ